MMGMKPGFCTVGVGPTWVGRMRLTQLRELLSFGRNSGRGFKSGWVWAMSQAESQESGGSTMDRLRRLQKLNSARRKRAWLRRSREGMQDGVRGRADEPYAAPTSAKKLQARPLPSAFGRSVMGSEETPITTVRSSETIDVGRSSSRVNLSSVDKIRTLQRTRGLLPRKASVWYPGIEDESEKVEVVLPSLEDFLAPELEKSREVQMGNLPRMKTSGKQPWSTDNLSSDEARSHPSGNVEMAVPSIRYSTMLSSSGLETTLGSLDPRQRSAVTADLDRPCIILAGPGSGKTRVLIHRISYLIKHCGVHPSRILAVTFTNKATNEMKERIDKMLDSERKDGALKYREGSPSSAMTVGTFHSICARFLRIYGDNIGLANSFQIIDSADRLKIMNDLMDKCPNIKDELSAAQAIRHISKAKVNEKYLSRLVGRTRGFVTELGALYSKKLRSLNMLDFDDLLLEARRMLRESPDVLRLLQNRYDHVLVDEWQDTNAVQYDIFSSLAREHRNLFVVGDADQSIYKFRGADSQNVTRFTMDYPEATRIYLEENYRSSGCIVTAAQAVIEKNDQRPDKMMQTSNDFGVKIVVCCAPDAESEAHFVIKESQKLLTSGAAGSFNNFAVMYRTNAQSRVLEEMFVKFSIPYRLMGGLQFYDRHEVKDVLAYLRVVANPADDMSLSRILNTPTRGIGPKTAKSLFDYAEEKRMTAVQALESLCSSSADNSGVPFRATTIQRLRKFYEIYKNLCDSAQKATSIAEAVQAVLRIPNFEKYVRSGIDSSNERWKGDERWANVLEMQTAAANYESLTSFLEYVVLVSGSGPSNDINGKNTSAISLMTLHSAKGLEFSAVYIAGMEEGLVPMLRSTDDGSSLEEERRLAYVGMTRAKERLYLIHKLRRPEVGAGIHEYKNAKPSRFLRDIPSKLTKNVVHSMPGKPDRLKRSFKWRKSRKTGKPVVAVPFNEARLDG